MKAKLTTRRDKQDKASTTFQVTRVVEDLEGKELFTVRFWPDSPKSCESADAWINDFCKRSGIHIIEENGYDVLDLRPNYEEE